MQLSLSDGFPSLLKPGRIGKLWVKNRIIMAPMSTRYPGKEGEVTDRLLAHYAARARGGVGLIVVERTLPADPGAPARLSLHDDRFVPGLKTLTDTIHEADCHAAIQISPGLGRLDKTNPVCSSEVPVYLPLRGSAIRPHALSSREIAVIVERFADGVARAKAAGFDAMLIHGAGSYLMMDFLSSTTNKRTDDYGGDFARRARFALELVRASKEVVGQDSALIFRLCADQRADGGFSFSDALTLAPMLVDAGVDAIEVTTGAFATLYFVTPPAAVPPACNRALSEVLKTAVDIPIAVSGRINDPLLAESVLENGEADFVALGRSLLADPELPRKLAEGQADDIRRCVVCLNCLDRVGFQLAPITCTVNPRVGNETEPLARSVAKPKRVMIIGAGPAGLEAASVAAERGHQVTLWEKSPTVGGLLNVAATPPHKEDVGSFLNYLRQRVARLPVKVILDREVDLETVLEASPDVVVVATGSRPSVPPIPGLDGESLKVVFAKEVLEGKSSPLGKVLILGGNSVGCETAEFLGNKGCQVTITTLEDGLARDLPEQNRLLLLRRLDQMNILIMPRVKYEAIRDGSAIISLESGKTATLQFDYMVLAAGAMPEDALYLRLLDHVPECYRIGDCAKPRKILDAIHEGAAIGARI